MVGWRETLGRVAAAGDGRQVGRFALLGLLVLQDGGAIGKPPLDAFAFLQVGAEAEILLAGAPVERVDRFAPGFGVQPGRQLGQPSVQGVEEIERALGRCHARSALEGF